MSASRSSEWKEVVERLYRRHFRLLLGRACRSLRDRNTAAETVQQVFTNLLSKDRRFAGEEEAEKFLFAAFQNLLIDHIRKEVRWKYSALDAVHQGRMAAGAHQEDDLVRGRMRDKQLPLPPRDRYVFEMAYFEGKSDQEIAGELKMNIHTLQRSLVRSRKVLQQILEERHGISGGELRELFSRRKG